jgi:hypothetical protein
MAETLKEQQTVGAVAPEVPATKLPPATYRDLPEVPPLRKLIGPSVISAGVGLASGEFIIQPYIASLVGLAFLWVALLAVTTQFFINMEVERYTLATGETAITGFSRFWKPWGLVFCVGAVLPNLFPGWVTSATTVLTFATGWGEGAIVPISIAALFIIGVALTLSPVVYQTVEKVEFFKVGAVLFFLVVVLFFAISADAYRDTGQIVTSVGQLPEGLPPALVLAGVAAAGAGGVHNLVQSNWIRDKGFGMGFFIPRVVSPLTGEDQAEPSTGYMFRQTEENRERWKGWWRVANWEHFLSFYLLAIFTISVMVLLAYSTVYGQDIGEGLDFLRGQGEALQGSVAPWFGTFFWAIGAVSLFAAAMGIIDYVGRLVGDVLKVSYLADSRRWTESKIYFAVIWSIILVGTGILLAGLDAPLVLLLISQSINGMIMAVYCVLLIKLNRSVLPAPAKPGGVRTGLMFWAVLFYGFFSVALIVSQVRDLFG